jgi:hypothetical protein
MVDKNLNASIQLRYDTLNNWIANSSQILRKGEVACVEIPALDTTSGVTNPPTVIFKVGDGTTPFAKLAWSSALAADVHTWAKQAALPVKCVDDITVDGYVEGNVISSITFANNEIQYTTTQVPTKNQMDIIEAALGSYISIKDRAIFENISFGNKAISSDIFTLLNSSIVSIQEGHKYRFEIINKENPDDQVIKSFEAVAKQNEQITSLIIDFVDSTEGFLYITDFATTNGRVNYLYHGGIYKLDISESTVLPEGHIYLSLMPDNIKQSDSSTQYNYIKNNYIFNMYECGQLVLDIEAGAQVNKIDSVSSDFVISANKQLELAQSVKDSLTLADSAVQNVIVYPTWSTGDGKVSFGHAGFDLCTENATGEQSRHLAFDIRTADSGYININTDLGNNECVIAELSLDTTAAAAIEKAQTAIQTITSNCTAAQETSGLKVTQTENSVNVEIDDAVTFIFDCGNSKF